MVAAIGNDIANNGSGISITGGTTWNSLTSGLTSQTGYRLFWKIAGPSEPANYSVSYNSSDDAYSVAMIVTSNDAAPDPPVWQVTQTTGSGNTGPTPGITPPDATALEVRFILASNNSAANRSWTAPAGLTERADVQANQWVNGSAATRTLDSDSATGSLNFTANGSVADRVGFTVGIPSGAFDQGVEPDGISSAEAFGNPRLGLTISLSGIASGEAFGGLVVSTPTPQVVSPDGVAAGEAFGTLRTRHYISPDGLASAEAFGTLRAGALIRPEGIASAEIFGLVVAGVEQFPSPAGIPAAEGFGTPILQLGYPQTVIPRGIESLERLTHGPVVRLMHRLTLRPPSVQETPAGRNILHSRYGIHRGISLIQRADGSIYATRYPALTDLEAAQRYWLGGYAHTISVEEAELLTAAGFGDYIILEEVQ